MIIRNHVLKNAYRDSVALMRLSREVEGLEGVEQANAIMGTENNKSLLSQAGLLDQAGRGAGSNDLIVALGLKSIEWEAAALEVVQQRLASGPQGTSGDSEYRPRTLEGALQLLPQANLAIISVPGTYAAREARKALDAGLHVLLFSDNVSLEDEVELKRRAIDQGLFMLGPDCGTAIINGVPLGFANAAPAGRVGLVAASGSGLQHVICLLAASGEGISHGLGVGGRDLSDQVGGVMMLEGLRALQEDPATELIVLISKPPGRSARDGLMAALRLSAKPCVVAFLGDPGETTNGEHIFIEHTLEDAARRALNLLGKETPAWASIPEATRGRLQSLSSGLASGQRRIRGLYSGGTLCYEALLVLRELGHEVDSNLEPKGADQPRNGGGNSGHLLVDLGDDLYTVGRPHPMIDFRSRCDEMVQAAADPDVGVLLIDLVLGYGTHPDPAADLVPALREVQHRASRRGGEVACVVAMCGSHGDPQSLSQQEEALTEAGAVVVHSNALAARIASALSRNDLSALPQGDGNGE